MSRDWMEEARDAVNAALERTLRDKREAVAARSPRSAVMVDEIAALTLRGGKRLRPMVLLAAREAVAPGAPLEDAMPACEALELLQSYLLIHDDWMDGDLVRRDGPSVHAAFRASTGDDALGDAVGVLAGDLAGTMAWERFLATLFPADAREALMAAWITIQEEVYLGQHLDLVGDPDVSRMHDLKTGSYTVRGPVRLGALLGGASEAAAEALEAWAAPLGHAFQVRDDLLGTFDEGETGKPGDDLRHGKLTSLVAEARATLSGDALAAVEAVLGVADADDRALGRALEALEAGGIRAALEARLEAHLAEASAAVADAPLSASGVARLEALAQKLAIRRL